MALHRSGGKTVAHHEQHGAWQGRDGGAIAQAPPEVWAEEVGAPVGRLAVHCDVRQTRCFEIGKQRGDVERGVDRITRRGVGRLEVEMRRSRQAVADTTQRYARWREAPQIDPARRWTIAAGGHRKERCISRDR